MGRSSTTRRSPRRSFSPFAKNPDAAVKKMPGRVQRAPHLGHVLLDQARADIDDPRNARNLIESWRQDARRRRVAQTPAAGTLSRAPDGAGHPLVLTDFQAEWQKFALTMKQAGVEP
jgi:hypothetical protein